MAEAQAVGRFSLGEMKMPNPCPKCNYFPMRCRCDELKLEAENKDLHKEYQDIATLLDKSETENARLLEALERLQTWAKAYPLNVFPEPDFKKVAVVLKAAGLSLDAVSASNMRHVISRAKDITDQALKEK